jgi:hypothetical protein
MTSKQVLKMNVGDEYKLFEGSKLYVIEDALDGKRLSFKNESGMKEELNVPNVPWRFQYILPIQCVYEYEQDGETRKVKQSVECYAFLVDKKFYYISASQVKQGFFKNFEKHYETFEKVVLLKSVKVYDYPTNCFLKAGTIVKLISVNPWEKHPEMSHVKLDYMNKVYSWFVKEDALSNNIKAFEA